MALFNEALKIVLDNEGGYNLHKVPGDRGGLTFAGIAYNMHPKWEGWEFIEDNDVFDPIVKKSVSSFYRDNFWLRIGGPKIKSQYVANSIFDCAVNMGVSVSSKMAQIVCKAHIDGIIGKNTVASINNMDDKYFLSRFAIARISTYSDIVSRNPDNVKFLNGWIKRALRFI